MTVDTRVPRFCVGPRLVAILLINTHGEEKFLSPSAMTTISWPAFTTPDPSIALDSAPVYNDAAVPVADPGFLKGGGARSAPQNLAPPTFYILMARAHAHHMNRTEHEHLS